MGSTGAPDTTRAVIRRLPGNVISPNPIRNSGNPPGPGTSGPSAIAVRISSHPRTFFSRNQNQFAKTDGRRCCPYVSTTRPDSPASGGDDSGFDWLDTDISCGIELQAPWRAISRAQPQ